MGQLGNFEEGKVYCEKGLIAANENDFRTLGLCELQYGYLLTTKGDGKLAIKHFQKCIEYVEEMKWIFVSALAWTGLGLAYGLVGDPDTSRKHIEKGLSMQREAGIEWWLSLQYYYLGQSCFLLGNLKSARSFVEEALKLAQKKNEKHVEGMSLTGMGRILGKTDRSQSAKAEDYIQQGIKILDELMLKPLSSLGHLFLGELYLDIDLREKALKNLKKAETLFQKMGMDYWLDRTQQVLDRL